MGSLAEQKKAILPYLQRADEIAQLDPKVAYYCRLYAVQQGVAITNRAPEIEGVLQALMEKLEKDSPLLQKSPEDGQYCEQFAMVVFNRADRADRAGKADHNTVKAFYVASVFIDILRQFSPDGELPVDMAERQQYAAWKAADIRKALREGRTPDAGPPVKQEDLDLPGVPGSLPDVPSMSNASDDFGLPSVPSASFPAAPAQTPPTAAPPSGPATGQPRFRRGSKVYFTSGPEAPPAKGTVVVVTPEASGSFVYKVGLSQQIVDAPEASLAHDFALGEHILYQPKSGPPVDATVEQLDDSQWPVAYKLSLADGSTQMCTDQRLQPKEAEPSKPGLGGRPPRSPSRSPPKRLQSSSPPPSEHTPFSRSPQDTAEADALPPHTLPTGPPPHLGKVDSAYQGPSEDSRDAGEAADSPTDGFASPASDLDAQTSAAQPPAFPPSTSVPPPSTSASKPQLPPVPPPSFQRKDFMASPSGPASNSVPSPSQGPPPAVGMTQPQPAHAAGGSQSSVIVTRTPGFVPPLLAMSEAQKLSKYAVSSLGFEDVPTAIEYLTKALKLLTEPQT